MIGVRKIKIAIISDIHGNIVALDAILESLKNENIDKILALGDLCNEIPCGNEVINRLKEIKADSLKGNKEEYFLDYEKNKYTWENLQFKNTIFMYNQLSKENMQYIRDLPFELNYDFEGIKIKSVHGSPEHVYEFIHEYDEDLLDKYTRNLEEDILVLGHTHDPIWIKEKNGKIVINAGCAGVSVFNIGQAEFVILKIENGKYEIEKRIVKYDFDKLKEKIIESGILEQEKTFINLVYLALIGKREIRREFYHTGIDKMLQKGKKLYRDDAKGIYKTFRLLDDDIWLEQTEKVKHLFLL